MSYPLNNQIQDTNNQIPGPDGFEGWAGDRLVEVIPEINHFRVSWY